MGLYNSVNVITTISKQRFKPSRHKLCRGKLGTSNHVKSFAIGS